MTRTLTIEDYQYDIKGDMSVGTLVFSNGATARIEHCLPLGMIIKGIWQYADSHTASSDEAKFAYGVLRQIIAQTSEVKERGPRDPFKEACLQYALNCGWFEGYTHNLSHPDDDQRFSKEALLMAAAYLKDRGGVISFGTLWKWDGENPNQYVDNLITGKPFDPSASIAAALEDLGKVREGP